MKFIIWTLAAFFLIFAASCNLLNPTANQVTIEASNQSGSGCGVTVNLDGNYSVGIGTGSYYTFPIVNPGSHTLNFSTGGTAGGNCVFTNNNSVNYSTTFNTTGGIIYVGTVKPYVNGSGVTIGYDLTESGP